MTGPGLQLLLLGFLLQEMVERRLAIFWSMHDDIYGPKQQLLVELPILSFGFGTTNRTASAAPFSRLRPNHGRQQSFRLNSINRRLLVCCVLVHLVGMFTRYVLRHLKLVAWAVPQAMVCLSFFPPSVLFPIFYHHKPYLASILFMKH